MIFSLTLIATTNANTLVYDSDTDFHRAQLALDSLSMSYTVANSSSFNTLLIGGQWDLVIIDCPNSKPGSLYGYWAPLLNYIENNGKVIMSYWDLDADPSLGIAFDVSVTSSFISPQNIYPWISAHPIFNNPNPIEDLFNWNDRWNDNGDRLALIPQSGAEAIAGFTVSSQPGQAAIVLGTNGNTIYNGFLFDDLKDPIATNLIANEIMHIIPEPATVSLLAFGVLLLRKRK